MLHEVVAGAALPLNAAAAEAARQAAARLRSQLLQGRDVDWLLSASAALAGDPAFEVGVVSDDAARQLLDDEIRSDVGSLVGLLRRHQPWERVTVTLTARRQDQLSVTVVATGACGNRAARDPAIGSAAGRLGAVVNLVDERNLVIEGVIPAAVD